MRQFKFILPTIVLSQFCCTSLWFASNGVINELIANFHLTADTLGHLTSSIQFGFISGTLTFAILTIADRFSPSKTFFICAIIGAILNGCLIGEWNNIYSLLLLRYFTGFFLAGIYPIGMKIASDYFNKGLGKSLGYLVGALVLGTAFPHLLKGLGSFFNWKYVIISTSLLAAAGGTLMFIFVGNGPYQKPSQKINLTAFFKIFKNKKFKSASLGYFGHMWELYAFWAFIPFVLKSYQSAHPTIHFNTPLWSFIIIGIGSLACVLGGYLSNTYGTKKTAFSSLLLSGCCCLLSPLIFQVENEYIFLLFLLLWGMFVIADSPLFSTLVAQNATAELKGTALTIVNCIGFSITIVSIQLLNMMKANLSPSLLYLFLAIGPAFGLWALKKGQAD